MSNMSYCRFRNTLSDLRDCYESMEEEPDDAEEKRAKERIIKLCARIADEYGEQS
jgi:hypothetical protein